VTTRRSVTAKMPRSPSAILESSGPPASSSTHQGGTRSTKALSWKRRKKRGQARESDKTPALPPTRAHRSLTLRLETRSVSEQMTCGGGTKAVAKTLGGKKKPASQRGPNGEMVIGGVLSTQQAPATAREIKSTLGLVSVVSRQGRPVSAFARTARSGQSHSPSFQSCRPVRCSSHFSSTRRRSRLDRPEAKLKLQ
jgi:hypothetical protein